MDKLRLGSKIGEISRCFIGEVPVIDVESVKWKIAENKVEGVLHITHRMNFGYQDLLRPYLYKNKKYDLFLSFFDKPLTGCTQDYLITDCVTTEVSFEMEGTIEVKFKGIDFEEICMDSKTKNSEKYEKFLLEYLNNEFDKKWSEIREEKNKVLGG